MSTVAELHHEYLMAKRRLMRAVRAECKASGGKHVPRLHRPDMPPWCSACGKSATGVQIRDDR